MAPGNASKQARMKHALAEITNQERYTSMPKKSLREIAREFDVPRSSLQQKKELCKLQTNRLLYEAEETILVDHIKQQSIKGQSLTPDMCKSLVVEIVNKRRPDFTVEMIGKNWYYNPPFLQHNVTATGFHQFSLQAEKILKATCD